MEINSLEVLEQKISSAFYEYVLSMGEKLELFSNAEHGLLQEDFGNSKAWEVWNQDFKLRIALNLRTNASKE